MSPYRPSIPGKVLHAALLVCWICAATVVSALDPEKQITQYSLRSWTTGDGLPQDTVRSMAQTPDGYWWLATEAGLVRFDGMRLEVYDRSTHPQHFRSAHIYALAVDSAGTLWIGTYGGGLLTYRDGAFERLAIDGLDHSRITVIEPGATGEMWVGTYGEGLARWHDGQVERFGTADGLPHPVIFDLEADADGVWVASYGGGLARWEAGTFSSWTTNEGLPSDDLWAVLNRSEGGLWIGTNRGLALWLDGEFRRFTAADGLPHERVISLLEDRHGQLWLGTYGGGLVRRSGDRFDVLTTLDGMKSDSVWTLAEDREGGVWAGTLGGGAHQLVEGAFVTFSVEEGLASRLPSAFFEGPDQSLWIASREHGLDRLINGRFEHLDSASGLSSNSTWAVHVDRHGGLWVGTSGSGLDYRDPAGRWHHYTTTDGLADNVVFGLAEDPDGSLWISTNTGLSRFDGEQFHHFSTADGLASDQTRRLLFDRDNRLLVATTRGLNRRLADGSFESIGADVLAGHAVQDVYEDEMGSLWIASNRGLTRWRDGVSRLFDRTDGLPDDNLRSVLADDHGFLWLATSRGISRISRQQLDAVADGHEGLVEAVSYGLRDGLKNSVCYGGSPAAIRTSDGRLWFATLDGVARVDPAKTQSSPAPPVLIEGLWVDGQRATDTTIGPGRRTFEIRFTAMNLRIPDKIRVRHRLRGFDDRWRETRSGVALFNNLGPGDYELMVHASDELGRFVGEPSTFAFSITPSFVQRPISWLLGLGMIGLVGWSLHRLRVLRFKRREHELSQRVDEVMANLKMLRGLLPMCSHCKRIRDDQGYWERLETYLMEHSEASLSHGICPDCVRDHFGELFDAPDEPAVPGGQSVVGSSTGSAHPG